MKTPTTPRVINSSKVSESNRSIKEAARLSKLALRNKAGSSLQKTVSDTFCFEPAREWLEVRLPPGRTMAQSAIETPLKNHTGYEILVDSIDKIEAEKFWNLGRPYFFAVKKQSDEPCRARDIEKLQESFLDYFTFSENLDNYHDIYFIKSSEKREILRLPSVAGLQALGIPSIPIRGIWSLGDDMDHDNMWQHLGRATLYTLFKTENQVVGQDVDYAEQLTGELTKGQFKAALNGALFLSSGNKFPTFVRMLLDAGAEPNAAEHGLADNRTALAFAIDCCALDSAEALLKAGADPAFSPAPGVKSGRAAAEEAHCKEAFSLFKRYETR